MTGTPCVEETLPSGSQRAPAFHRFPLLPAEIQIQIWRRAASVPRAVVMQPDTAASRSALPSPVTVPGSVPALLHASHLSRQVCLPIYKHRFQVHGHGDLWETYILADHDILALDDDALLFLLANLKLCRAERNRIDGHHHLPFSDMVAWSSLLRQFALRPDTAVSPATLTPAIEAYLRECLRPPPITGVRGDFTTVQRVILFDPRCTARWPGLLDDAHLRANLERAFHAVVQPEQNSSPSSSSSFLSFASLPREETAQRLAQAGVGPLPPRFHHHHHHHQHHYHHDCVDCVDCGQHADVNDGATIAVAHTPLACPAWLAALAVALRRGVSPARGRLGNDVIMWWLGRPRDVAGGGGGSRSLEVGGADADAGADVHGDVDGDGDVNGDGDEDGDAYAAYAAYLQTYVYGVRKPIVTVYYRGRQGSGRGVPG